MNAQTVIEVLSLVAGGSGGVGLISKLTRLAVAIETGAEQMKSVIAELQATKTAVQDHEVRLAKGGL